MRLGVMCSGEGTNFQNLITYPQMKHEIVLMIHNTKKCGAVARAAKFGIPHIRIPHKDEDKMIALFEAYRVDLIVLAGYMRVLRKPSEFHCPIINVHPSLLPKYKGLHAVEQALESGDKETGCTVHYVNEELDGGAIIDRSIVPICPDDTVATLTQRIQRAEYRLLPLVINHYESKESNKESTRAALAL